MTRFLLFLLVAVSSLWVGLFCFGDGTIHKVVIYLGYPSIFATFIIFAWSLVQLHRKEWDLRKAIPRKPSAWVVIGLVTGLLVTMEPLEFKIVYDEVILSVSAQLLHFHRLAGVPQEANDYFGSYLLMESILDKRPFFFPFLLSLVHDLAGFRYQNAFFLNAGLTLVLITLIYVIGKRISGHRGGILAVLLAATLPLLGIFASSGHFEILNLVMIALIILLGIIYLEEPGEVRLVPLVFGLLLLTQVRYENCLYLLPFGILILLGWRSSGRPLLPATVIISPIFLILHTLQFRMVQTADTKFFQEGPNGRTDVFSLSYFGENLEAAVNFFFWAGMDMPNSLLLSVLGFTAVGTFIYWLIRRGRNCLGKDPVGTCLLFFLLSMGIYALVIGVFNFGMFDRYITHRLSLPMYLFFIILTPFIFRRFGRHYLAAAMLTGLVVSAWIYSGFDRATILSGGLLFLVAVLAFTGGMYWIWKYAAQPRFAFFAVPVVFILTTTLPIGQSYRYSQSYKSNDILMEQIAFLDERKGKEKILFIAGSQYPAMLTKTNTTFVDVLAAHPRVAWEHLRRRMYSAIYISRRFERTEESEWKLVKPEEYLDPEVFKLETVHVKHLKPDVLLEFSRLVEVVLPEDAAE